MKKKILSLLIFGLILNCAYTQNKKEQIEALNFSIDSLKNIVSNERVNIQNKTKEIEVLSKKVLSNQTEIYKVKNDLENLHKKENLNGQTIIELRNQIDLFSKKNKLKNCIIINSDKPINGFDLMIIFYPKEITFGFDETLSLYRGYCVFNFIKDGYIFPFQIDYFGLPLFSAKGIKFSEDSTEILNCQFQEITVDLTVLPISFQDLNFDGEDEMIISNLFGGQRGFTAYDAFSIKNDWIYDISHWFGDEVLDESTVFDPIKKQVTISHHNGADSSYKTVYQAIFENNHFLNFKFLKRTPFYN